jgi:hypothetical protein
LYLAVGDKVVVTENLSAVEGIVNGSKGIVKFFVFASPTDRINHRPPLAVGVQFEDKLDWIKRQKYFKNGVSSLLQSELAHNTIASKTKDYYDMHRIRLEIN